MITDDEIMQLIEAANPVPRRDHVAGGRLQASDVASYIAELDRRDASVSPVDVAPTSAEPARRPRWLLASAATVAAIAVGALALVASDGGQAPDETRAVSSGQAPPSGPYYLDLQTLEPTPLESPDAVDCIYPSPDGSRLLCYTPNDVLAIANADGSGAIALGQLGNPEWEPAQWSPDGTSIVYEERRGEQLGNLFVRELTTGRKTQITDFDLTAEVGWYWIGPSFSPDGQRVIYMMERAGSEPFVVDTWSVPVTGGDPELLIENAAFPRYLPDGRIIYVRDEPFGTELWIADPDGSSRLLVEAQIGIELPTPSPDGAHVAYKDGDSGLWVLEVETGEVVHLDGTHLANRWGWADGHTLLISPGD